MFVYAQNNQSGENDLKKKIMKIFLNVFKRIDFLFLFVSSCFIQKEKKLILPSKILQLSWLNYFLSVKYPQTSGNNKIFFTHVVYGTTTIKISKSNKISLLKKNKY